MWVFHGTTQQGLANILEGHNEKTIAPWVCSDDDGVTYVYPLDKLMRADGLDVMDNNDRKEGFNKGIQRALESAEVQALFTNETDLICLLMEVDEDYLQDDYSCNNMQSIASFIECEELSEAVKCVEIVHYKANIWRYPIIVSVLLQQSEFNASELDDNLVQAAQSIPSGFYPDTPDYPSYYEATPFSIPAWAC